MRSKKDDRLVFVYNIYLEQMAVDAVNSTVPLPVTAGIIQVNGRMSTQ